MSRLDQMLWPQLSCWTSVLYLQSRGPWRERLGLSGACWLPGWSHPPLAFSPDSFPATWQPGPNLEKQLSYLSSPRELAWVSHECFLGRWRGQLSLPYRVEEGFKWNPPPPLARDGNATTWSTLPAPWGWVSSFAQPLASWVTSSLLPCYCKAMNIKMLICVFRYKACKTGLKCNRLS